METLQEIRNINLVLRAVIFGSWEGIMMAHRAWQVVHQLQLSFQRFLDQQWYGIKQVSFLGRVVYSMQRERQQAKKRGGKRRGTETERKKGQHIKPNEQNEGKQKKGGKKVETFKENSSNRNNGTGEKEREQCSNITVSRDSFPRHYRRWSDGSCPPRLWLLPPRAPLGHNLPLSKHGQSFLGAEQHFSIAAVNFYRTLLAARLLHTWSRLLSCRT